MALIDQLLRLSKGLGNAGQIGLCARLWARRSLATSLNILSKRGFGLTRRVLEMLRRKNSLSAELPTRTSDQTPVVSRQSPAQPSPERG